MNWVCAYLSLLVFVHVLKGFNYIISNKLLHLQNAVTFPSSTTYIFPYYYNCISNTYLDIDSVW